MLLPFTNGIHPGRPHDPDGENSDLIAAYSYNAQHEPLASFDAAGQPTVKSYNAYGQVLMVTNPRNEVTIYSYGQTVPDGYLASITGPTFNGARPITSFTYDSAHRVHTVTKGPDNDTVTTLYDDLDRLTQISYPDNSTQEFQYTDAQRGMTLDLTASKDRQNRWTYRHYNANRQLHSITEPLPRTTYYDWCTCGALTDITDPNGNVTHFEHDLQSRVITKTYAYGTAQAQSVSYTYEDTTSRLKSMTDANNQTTNYQYSIDDNLSQVTYTNAQNPTPNLAYAYDPFYNRMASVTSSGPGVINGAITYAYYPVTVAGTQGANQVETVDGFFPNDTITYGYDELNRVTSQLINGQANAASVQYDSLGRLGTTTNLLGQFTRSYDTVTPRLQTLTYPNGQTTNYTYFDNNHDRRLQTLQNLATGSVNLSQFDYTYDAEGAIQSLNKLLGTNQTNLAFGYDPAQQLTSVTQGNLHFRYDYDNAGNRLTDLFFAQFSRGGNTFTANNLNQLDSIVRDPGVGPAQGPFPITYDGNGNMTDDGDRQTYEWDAANRLVAISYADTGNRTEFAYDGLGRRVKITEYGPAARSEIERKFGASAAFNAAEFTLSDLVWQIGNVTPRAYGLNFQAAQSNRK